MSGVARCSFEQRLISGLPERPNSIDDCWEWQKSGVRGYGTFRWMGQTYLAHRAAYELYKGAIPEGLLVRHSCHNPACCNPQHLSLGTNADNSRDMTTAGRSNRGSRHGNARLTEEKVRRIREIYTPALRDEIAAEYGVNRRTIQDAVNRVSWTHI